MPRDQDSLRANRRTARVTKAKLQTEMVRAAKDVPCMDCNSSFPYVCMDFDHVRGEKVADISRLVRRAATGSLAIEMAKCDVVCANCHRIRTAKRKDQPGA